MYVQENTSESIRLEKWRRTERQEKPLERSRNVRENSAEQARGKIKRSSEGEWWFGASCSRVLKQGFSLPFSLPSVEIICFAGSVLWVLDRCMFLNRGMLHDWAVCVSAASLNHHFPLLCLYTSATWPLSIQLRRGLVGHARAACWCSRWRSGMQFPGFLMSCQMSQRQAVEFGACSVAHTEYPHPGGCVAECRGQARFLFC